MDSQDEKNPGFFAPQPDPGLPATTTIQHGNNFSGIHTVYDNGTLNNFGNVTATNVTFYQNSHSHLNAERPKYPIFNVIQRNSRFVGRKDILNQIDARIHRYGRAVISGMAGVGKSQIALEYCHRFKEQHPGDNIFFAHAGSRERLVAEYTTLAEKLGIPGLDNPRVDILALVAQRLSESSHGRWLLVLDGADDRSLFSGGVTWSASSWVRYIPQCDACSVLVTTKDKGVGRLLDMGAVIQVECPGVCEAEELFRAQMMKSGEDEADEADEEHNDDDDDDDNDGTGEIAALVKEVGNLPLAINQAAAFIQNSPVSLRKYVQILQANLDEKEYLLGYGEANSVLCTFRLSFNQAAALPLTVSLLSLIAVFDRQGIPRWLLRETTREESTTEAEFADSLGKLISLSLITDEGNGEAFAMHQQAQLAVREWLRSTRKIRNYHERAVSKLADIFPMAKYQNWKECRVLFPHAQALLEYDTTSSTLPYATLLYKVARYQWQQEKLECAQSYTQKAYDIRQRKFLVPSKENPAIIDCLALLASVMMYRGFHAEAEEKLWEVLKWRRRVLGPNHSDTLDSTNELGILLRRTRRYAEAEKMHRQALRGRRKALQANDLATLETMDDLGVVLVDQGRYEEARKLHQKALGGKLAVLGREHPSTLTSMEDLASVLSEMGDLDQAQSVYQQSLNIYTKLLGKGHSDTLSCMNNLACVLIQQGLYVEAEEQYRQVSDAYTRIFGKQHQYTLTSLQNLSRAQVLQGRYADAEMACRDALMEMETSYGNDHTTTLICRRRLADILRLQNRNADAEHLYRRALEGWENRLMDDREEIDACISGLINVLRAEGNDYAAERIQRRWNWSFLWYSWALCRHLIRIII
ncbi:P-loop containing nucleoside triphosphate hydrolase protein [Aspergillus cavernicola]|uniref:P-loop containing nucleoside triphosphate hydrolase protein n=1 Tax=Aspergillus cavernicola TaxID=176166 RepID=A0ABR4IFH0_9EURO